MAHGKSHARRRRGVKFEEHRPYADAEVAARKIIKIANADEVIEQY